MQELRLVFIIVGGLAIAGLLVHGILKSKKETKSKFADSPANKMDPKLSDSVEDEEGVISEAHVKAKSSERIEPGFGGSSPIEGADTEQVDPLFGSSDLPFSNKHQFKDFEPDSNDKPMLDPLVQEQEDSVQEPLIDQRDIEPFTDRKSSSMVDTLETVQDNQAPQFNAKESAVDVGVTEPTPQEKTTTTSKETKQDVDNDMEVIVFHVHAAGDGELNGEDLFPSMKQNGLLYGAMDIFHRHTDTSGTGKVLFSVANMMKPGTLVHDDPQTFNTKGISFFMTLPCFGEPEQNFKLMLRTAQQIADDLGANVLDDKRHLMTPDRIIAYRKQVRDFVVRQQQ